MTHENFKIANILWSFKSDLETSLSLWFTRAKQLLNKIDFMRERISKSVLLS
jgi:hypothetical protein